MGTRVHAWLLSLCVLLATACGDNIRPGHGPEAGPGDGPGDDARLDGGVDGFDAPSDGPGDAPDASDANDAGDGGIDAPPDAGIDAPPDAGIDAPIDAAIDAAIDAPIDAAIDAPIDAGIDAPIDAPIDAAIDAPIDAPVVCTGGETNCSGVCKDLLNDDANCGSCGHGCDPGTACSSGLCCPTGQTSCNGVCTDTASDDLHCGSCGNPCGPGEVCSASTCVPNCVAGTTLCNGVCINTLNDPNNCGGCGTSCTGGQICSNSTCACPQSAPDNCNGQCVDTVTDDQNCGLCGFQCTGGTTCTGGTCCAPGQAACGGTCVDTATDDDNCGSCGNACPAGSQCKNGNCDCGFNQILCNGVCVTPTVDSQNCGACGNVCNNGDFCVSNGCIGSCPAPLTGCSGACVNTADDNNNCGGCGIACPAGKGCSEGTCVTPVSLDPPPAGKCDGGGPPIDVLPGSSGGCTGQIAGVTFTFALCSCTDVGALSATLTTDGFDSTQGPYVPGDDGASVGVNNTISDTALMSIGGDLWVAGASGMSTKGDIAIAQRLLIAHDLTFSKLLTVNEDSFIGGSISRQGSGTFTTVDALTTPSCPPNGVGGVQYGSCVAAAPTVPAPCDCNASNEGKIDVRSIVTFFSNPANNDNASINLSQTVLDNPSGTIRIDLPCGKYYLNSINGAHPITIVAHGHVGLFIGGAIANSQELILDLDPTSTLDIFVGGVEKGGQDLTIGNPSYPRLTRVFYGSNTTKGNGACTSNSDCSSGICSGGNCVGSGIGNLTNAFQLSGNSFLNGLFYAGFGKVQISNPLEMYGAIFAKVYDASNPTTIHFDRAAADLASECNEVPPTTCTDCKDCNNQACGVFGFCTACTDDFDCCAPLRCNSGTCEL